MPEPVSTTQQRRSLGLAVTLHAETVTHVYAADLSNDRDHLVDLRLGDDVRGLSIIGDFETVRLVVISAAAELSRIAERRGW